MLAVVQPLLKLSLLSLMPKKAHAAEFVELSFERRKGARPCSSFWEDKRGQEYSAPFRKREK
jgi:hypothetical protein